MDKSISHFTATIRIIIIAAIFLCHPATTKVHNPLCPRHCVCLSKEAYCSGQGLSRVPRYLPQYAETIRLQDNSIRRLKYSGLKGLHLLKHLLMKGNHINYIEPGAFRDMTNLIALSLTNNNIRRLHQKAFTGLSRLKVLSLRKNRLVKMDKLFLHMHGLQLLNLGSNRIQEITEQSFVHNWQLQVLDLHDNRIKQIDRYSFRRLPFLKYLVLRDNPLKELDLDFQANFHLELLDFTNCQLTSIVKGLPHSIKDLRLSENQIRKIKGKDFSGVKKIRLLVLNNNMIESISDKALSRMWQLYDVYLGKNQLRKLPMNLPASLNGLFANYNNITTLPVDVFHKNVKLQKLYLRQNHITEVSPAVFQSLVKLRHLDLGKNNISHLESLTFHSNGWLELLDLSNNPLHTLEDDCFQGLENLRILQLSSVKPVATIKPAVFQDMKRLLFLDLSNSSRLVKYMTQSAYVLDYLYTVQDLNLMNNKLDYLPSKFPTYFPFLKVIKLVGNPWHCNAKLYWLTLWMQNNSIQFFAPSHMMCSSPEEFKGRNIISLSAEELRWHPPPSEAPLAKKNDSKSQKKGKHAGHTESRAGSLQPHKRPPDLSHHNLEPQQGKMPPKVPKSPSQKHPNSATQHRNTQPLQKAEQNKDKGSGITRQQHA